MKCSHIVTWFDTDETDFGPWKCPSGVHTTLSSSGLCAGGWWWGGGGCGDSVGIVGSGGGIEAGCGTECGFGSGDGATDAGDPTDGTGKESFWWWCGVDCCPYDDTGSLKITIYLIITKNFFFNKINNLNILSINF